MVMILDSQSKGRGFQFHLCCCHVFTTWMGNCLQTDELSGYIINHSGQLSLQSLWGW